ncbi:MAG: hypothetical protein HY551_04895 [Elusimicrobia bacterium]|nr:hypothetical protein [Elusimicrobiota bacterium]
MASLGGSYRPYTGTESGAYKYPDFHHGIRVGQLVLTGLEQGDAFLDRRVSRRDRHDRPRDALRLLP